MNRLKWAATLIAALSLSAGSALAQGGCRDDRRDRHDRYDHHDHHDRYDRYGDRDRGRHRGWSFHRGNRQDLYQLARRLEDRVDRFMRSFDRALDRSRLDGSRREDRLNEHAKQLERRTDELRARSRDGRRSPELVGRIFDEARKLDRFIERTRLTREAESDWRAVEHDLDRLARYYRVARWDRDPYHDDDRRRRRRG